MSGVSWGGKRCVVLLGVILHMDPRAVIMKSLRALETNLKAVTVGIQVKVDHVEWPKPSAILATGIVAAMSGVSWGGKRCVTLLGAIFTHGPGSCDHDESEGPWE